MKLINNININIPKIKQLFHAYFPIILLLILPHGWSAVILSFAYVIFSGYFYLEKANKGYPDELWSVYMVNMVITLVLLSSYVEAL